jgi:diguanylate cyclase (GGDEF)-like protein
MTVSKVDQLESLESKVSVVRSSIRGHILGGVSLIAALGIGTAITASSFRDRALISGGRELENTTLLLARHFDQQLEEFGSIQKGLVEYMHSTDIGSIEAYNRRMSGKAVHERLKIASNGSSDVAGVNIFDSTGDLINSSTAPLPTVNIADRAYFKAFKLGAELTSSRVELVQSRMTGASTVLVSRAMTGSKGEFLGLVTRGISTASFEQFLASVALGKDAVITMLHRDGTLLARFPHIDGLIGADLSAGDLFQHILTKATAGTMRLKSPVDGQDRLGSVRALADFPIVIIATTTISAALVDWRDQTRLLIGVAGLLVLVIIGMLFLVVRQLSRQHEVSQRSLALQKRRLDIAVNNMTQSLLLFDSSDRLIVCNKRYIEMFGLSLNIVKPGCSFRDLIAHRKENGSLIGDVDQYCSSVLRSMRAGKINLNVVMIPDGRSIQIVNQPLAEGGWLTTLEDITQRRRAEERVVHQAHYDVLTDLPNRLLFREHLEREIGNVQPGQQVAVLYLDIDEFKSVNDSLGHRIGDELLKSVAASLSHCVKATDFVARLGGDEFAIVQTAIDRPADVTELVQRIYLAIREPYECLGHRVTTDASIGIAFAPKGTADLDQLLQNADLAMYDAKAAGRRTFRFFKPEMDDRVRARCLLEADLRQAVKDRGFEVYYQPIVDLQSDQIAGFEALLRWYHPKRGMVSPVEFIPVAEETGLINQIGEWVLATACAEAANWPDGIKLAVNVSPVQFRSHTLVLKVAAALAASGLSPGRLELEITEAVLICDDEAALAILHQLRSLGVRIALDDFGTGYSSLSYLQRFPFDKIKIDRCFVTDIAEPGGASSSIIQAVMIIAAARNMTTTAEGVETERQKELLRTLGCTQMQGYLFSPARPAADIRKLIVTGPTKKLGAVA